jgi:hypothetical protein
MASTESDFFFPEMAQFSWTSSDTTSSSATDSPNSNIERILNNKHGTEYDPSRKVNTLRKKLLLTCYRTTPFAVMIKILLENKITGKSYETGRNKSGR